MKEVKKIFLVLFALAATAMMFVGCASKKGADVPSQPKQKTELLDWKGAALGQTVPEWVIAANESNIRIQQLSDFKDHYCFVVNYEGPNKDFATNWVKNTANGAAQISTMLATTVNSQAEAAMAGKEKDAETTAHIEEVRNAMSNASFKNARNVADFWILSKNDATQEQYYTAFCLWIVPIRDLNDQMAANFQNIIDNNKALSAAERSIYLDIITDIRARGLALSQ